jgi:hypothetical protein
MQKESNVKVSAEVQSDREQLFQRRTLESTILEAAMDKWREENEFGGDVDTESRTVTVGDFGGAFDIRTTYRYGFDENGGLHLWNEEDGEEAPEELADTPDDE